MSTHAVCVLLVSSGLWLHHGGQAVARADCSTDNVWACLVRSVQGAGLEGADTQPWDTRESPRVQECGVSTRDPGLGRSVEEDTLEMFGLNLGRIVGGDLTYIEAHPWQVSLVIGGKHTCGGSLVASDWVMTAAHCVYKDVSWEVCENSQGGKNIHGWCQSLQSPSDVTVVAGSTYWTSFRHSQDNVHTVSHIIAHPDYGSEFSYSHDIAMIQLSSSVDLSSPTTRAVCLPEPAESFTGRTCVVSGWGHLHFGGVTVEQLRSVAVPIISNSVCQHYTQGFDIRDIVVCAGLKSGGKDACQDDSGGPLVCKMSDGHWRQAGIVSNGDGCAQKDRFGIYTAVEAFTPWVRGVMSTY